MKIITIVGARPQFIKAATISRVIQEQYSSAISEYIVHTGQHYDVNMSDIFFEEMKIPTPHMQIALKHRSHCGMTGEMLVKLEEVYNEIKPDLVLVYGDTNSTLAGALAASKLHLPIAHVESGLRSFNKKMPEETNRILTDHMSDYLFCPTQTAVYNLTQENITQNVKNVGDVMYDAALFYRSSAIKPSTIALNEKGFFLATLHREENTNDEGRLRHILSALEDLASKMQVILLLHPRTRSYMKNFNISLKNVQVHEPVGYFNMLYLLEQCRSVLTDSGGLQKEAYFFGKRVLILRDETEWTELVEHDWAKVVGADHELIMTQAEEFLLKGHINKKQNLYGDGNAAELIIDALSQTL